MRKFRCAGDIIFDDVDITPGQICNVKLKPHSETCNFLQYLNPLTPEKPYFFAQIRTLAPNSKITLGIAGPDIASDAHPGNWIDSVGYHSDTGQCYTSHQSVANTEGEKFGIGDVFGVLVTYFGEKRSTVIFLKNGSPVATRFLFEPNHSRYLPTISLENGPIDLGLMWPEAAMGVPTYSEKNMLHWIRPVSVNYDVLSNMFIYNGKDKITGELIIQSPHPLSLEIQHFEVIIQEAGNDCPGPSISLATCSPLVPSPSSTLSQDYIRFDLDFDVQHHLLGQRIGWGIHYNPETRNLPDFNPKAEQLVYCYVTANLDIISGKMMMQPEGGFYPLVLLKEGASKVTIDVESNPKPLLTHQMDNQFKKELAAAKKILQDDLRERVVKESMLRKTDSVEVTITDQFTTLRLPADKPGIHTVQLKKPLTENSNFFLIRVRQLSEDSGIGVGVASHEFPLNKYPGKTRPSVGWTSKDGKMYRNTRHDGNLSGERYQVGDIIGVEMEAFAKEMSVALFTKNFRPVGTAYYTQTNLNEFLPTISLCANGYEVIVEVFWQNMMRGAPLFSVVDLQHWCLPPGSVVDRATNTVHVKDHSTPVSIQAPYSLHKGYNHFEVQLTKNFGPDCPPPAVVLSTATPLDPPPNSCLKLDFLRFWAVNEASALVQVGDLVGWGLLYIDESIHHDEEQLVICYLTVNRKILLVRVVYQPPGGFYPLVVLPPELNEVTLEFSATIIRQHPITSQDVAILVKEARELMRKENEILKRGGDPTSELGGSAWFRSLPSAEAAEKNGIQKDTSGHLKETVKDGRVEKSAKTNKMATTLTDPARKGKKLKQAQSKKAAEGDHKSSRSCTVL
ncbi:uncharacterized protein LOC101862618 [Aplysia californica]|uniref:Uncharacterized protein LOC101862618 n=1 Tax=Aplysia californica TaxID=6500 RepID=A0ABM0JA23_APLCA|nr:uncharacterized protein LOC101862618 [Aplysia californica]